MSMCRESRSGVGLSLGWPSDINSVGDGDRLPDFDRAECIEVGEGVQDSAHKNKCIYRVVHQLTNSDSVRDTTGESVRCFCW